MSYGLDLFAENSRQTFSSETKCYQYLGRANLFENRHTGRINANGTNKGYGWTHKSSIHSPSGLPIVFVPFKSGKLTYLGLEDQGDDIYLLYFAESLTVSGSIPAPYIFAPVSSDHIPSGYGLHVRDGTGNTVFASDIRTLVIDGLGYAPLPQYTANLNVLDGTDNVAIVLQSGSAPASADVDYKAVSLCVPASTVHLTYDGEWWGNIFPYWDSATNTVRTRKDRSTVLGAYQPNDTNGLASYPYFGSDVMRSIAYIDTRRYPNSYIGVETIVPSITGTSNIFATFNYQVFQGSQPFPGKWEALPSGASISTSFGTFNIPKVYLFTTFKTNGEYLEISFTAGTGSIDELPNTVTAAIDSGNSVVLTKDRTESGTVIYKVTGPSGWANTLANKGTSPTGVLTAETVSATVTVTFE